MPDDNCTNALERFCHTDRPGNNDAGAARQWLYRKRYSNPSDDSGTPPPDMARTIRLGIFRGLRRSDA
eukprot:25278-Prymnesium_polylepis.1